MNRTIQLLSGITCILLFASAAPVPAQNLALNKRATASTSGNFENGDPDPDYQPGKGVDGNIQTRWATGWKPLISTQEEVDQSWWQVDLGTVHNDINSVIIKWEFAFGRSYDIKVSSDNVTWTTAKHVAWSRPFNESSLQNVNWDQRWNSWLVVGIDSIYFDPVAARYIRFEGKTRGQPYGYSFWEFEVYADAPVPAEIPSFDYPGPTAPFTIKGGACPCEIINVGPVQYSPFMFHTNCALINRDGGYSDITFPGGTKTQWTYRWNMYNVGYIPINNMGGIWYGKKDNTVQGGAPTDDLGILPLPVTADIFTTWKCTYSSVSGSYTVAYDMWLDDGTEVMIFLNKTGRYAYRDAAWKQVTFGGITWDVCGNDVYCFDPVNRPIYSVDINLKDFYKVLIDAGKISSERKLTGMWVGTETGGSGTTDRPQGELTTTEWTIRSPQATVSAWNPIEKAPSAAGNNAATAARRLITLGTSANAARRPGGECRYSIRGERLGNAAGRNGSSAGIVLVKGR